MAKKQKTHASFSVKSVIFCDDIREERSGKEILIGVYRDAAVFPEFPAFFLTLYMRIGVVFHVENAKSFSLKLIDENGIEKVNIETNLPSVELDKVNYIKIGMPMLAFDKPSSLTVLLGLDSLVEPIEKFEVRLPVNDVERSSFLIKHDA